MRQNYNQINGSQLVTDPQSNHILTIDATDYIKVPNYSVFAQAAPMPELKTLISPRALQLQIFCTVNFVATGPNHIQLTNLSAACHKWCW